jgi:replicative superfamily II helicase
MLSTQVVEKYGLKYSWPTFNPMQELGVPLILKRDQSNLVVNALTGSGKTELFKVLAATTLHPDEGEPKKVAYVGTHKALVEQKADECREAFPEAKVVVLTGDYTLTERRRMELEKADIILMTAEMLDSRVRNRDTERNAWLQAIGSLTFDEFHLMGDKERGDKVEAGLMRFARFMPKARILVLSATMANVANIKTWLEHLTGRETKVIQSSWRACPLEYEYSVINVPRVSWNTYMLEEQARLGRALEIVKAHPESQFLVFTGNKRWGREFCRLAEEDLGKVLFHNADLKKEDRKKVEQAFLNGQIRVMVATTTVAWGCNLPAERVIIAHQRLGLTEMSGMDLQQMAGRAGRPQFHPKGYVHIIVTPGERGAAEVRLTQPCVVDSQIASNLPFHILAGVSSGDIRNGQTMLDWYEDSFARFQNPVSREKLVSAVSHLRDLKMIETGSTWTCTPTGRTTARLYLDPQDAADWIRNFKDLPANPSDAELAFAFTDTGTNSKDYLSNSDIKNLSIRIGDGGVPKWASACYEALCVEERKWKFGPQAAALRQDIERIGTFLNLVARYNDIHHQMNRLATRVKYGISEELVDLVSLDEIGGKRAQALANNGIRSPLDVIRAGEAKIARLLGPATAAKAYQSALRLAGSGAPAQEEPEQSLDTPFEELPVLI